MQVHYILIFWNLEFRPLRKGEFDGSLNFAESSYQFSYLFAMHMPSDEPSYVSLEEFVKVGA